ncbi:MAG: nuclear transport factor 2 family protein [Alphaproteobacteria bacterium]
MRPTALFAALALALAGCAPAPRPTLTPAAEQAEKQAILDVIARMQDAWNRGDFRGYMEGFANPDVVFVSKGRFQRDWQGTLDHYIRDYGGAPERRGTLRFFDIRIVMLAPDAAQLISRYQLDRPKDPQDGINTRLMRKRNGRWVIWLNHVSSIEPPR